MNINQNSGYEKGVLLANNFISQSFEQQKIDSHDRKEEEANAYDYYMSEGFSREMAEEFINQDKR
jgi:hypothetical protein